MDLELSGRGTVITGSSRGIGRATALAFAREGAQLAICARAPEPLAQTADELRACGVKVHAQTCDVAVAEQLNAFLEASHAALGSIDILINNASGFGVTDDEKGWSGSFSVDVMASVRASWKVVPWMEQSGGGSIVHISSTSGLEAGSPPPYAAMKAALISHAKTLAIELAPRNIRVNCVAPGSIEFPGGLWETVRTAAPERYEAIRESIPFGRLGRDHEVANAVVFLASNAARWITGVTLAVDGGQHKANL